MSGTVLLTGATGFVGRQVLRELGEKGAKVRVILRQGAELPSGYSTEIESVIRTPDLFSETTSWWKTACTDIDTIVHVAWYAEPGKYLNSPKNLECLIGTLTMARGAAQAGVRRFAGIGTCFEYDLSQGMLSVDTSLKPLTPYAGAKAAAFLALSQCLPAENVEFTWCRLFYLYGEGEDSRRLVPYIHDRLSTGKVAELTSGNQIRDFLDVRDAARQIIESALGQAQGAVNICSGVPVTVKQLAENIADEYGRRDLLKFGVRQENQVDPLCVVGIR